VSTWGGPDQHALFVETHNIPARGRGALGFTHARERWSSTAGQVTNASLADYKIPSTLDIPTDMHRTRRSGGRGQGFGTVLAARVVGGKRHVCGSIGWRGGGGWSVDRDRQCRSRGTGSGFGSPALPLSGRGRSYFGALRAGRHRGGGRLEEWRLGSACCKPQWMCIAPLPFGLTWATHFLRGLLAVDDCHWKRSRGAVSHGKRPMICRVISLSSHETSTGPTAHAHTKAVRGGCG